MDNTEVKPAEPMSDLGKHLFDQMTEINRAQAIAIKLGRQQVARDIMGILNAESNNGRAITQIFSLCNREAK